MRWAKYRHLTPSGVFPDRLMSYIDFTDDTVVQCDVPIVKKVL